ncbi:Lin0512 family protein [Aliiroseovarius sp. KMU-50]|uniref:Lin0512 family protein n=1 Tax=Aliiroseovarius salicola TaxID=3009082 RepID=A0ABT4VZ90_9RHOB|nr:Lin0512 family protein [Aliiroseovarius sp. KMU-50]MDA5093586.1 Lin0512 family protein [Aliiroseovarius sp. KMU-50]
MAKTRVLVEFGMGSSLRRMDYTEACARAIKDALWHNSVNMAELFGFEKENMIVDVEVAVQAPDQVDTSKLAAIFPYGQISVTAKHGGLDVPKPANGPSAGHTVIANAAIAVSFDMEAV